MKYLLLMSLLLTGCSAADFPGAATTNAKPQAERTGQDMTAKENFRQELAAAIRKGG